MLRRNPGVLPGCRNWPGVRATLLWSIGRRATMRPTEVEEGRKTRIECGERVKINAISDKHHYSDFSSNHMILTFLDSTGLVL
jgi:hypothetical protein